MVTTRSLPPTTAASLGTARHVAPQRGTVQWFNLSRGYGVITSERGKEVYVNWKDVQREGFRNLNQGERVEFDVARSKGRLVARNVRVVE